MRRAGFKPTIPRWLTGRFIIEPNDAELDFCGYKT